MGLFLSLATGYKRSTKPAGLRTAPTTKQNAATLNRLGCVACPLNNADVTTPKMKPTLGVKDHVYFLAEAPGRHEDETSGQPLTGPSGKLLRSCIPDDEEDKCSFDNVVRDRPENNRTPVWTEVECCRNHIVKSIEQAKPRVIVGLGRVPLNWMLKSTDIKGMRGRTFAVQVGAHQCWFIPTYHPSFVLREAYDKNKPLNSRIGHCFRMDLQKVFTADLPPAKVDGPNDIRAGVQGFDGSEGYPVLLKLLKRASEAPIKAIDLETSTLRPFEPNARILTCALSFDDVNFSFAIDHPKSKWKPSERAAILAELKWLLTNDTKKVVHNVPFELEWFIKYFGYDVVKHHVWECTQMQSHFVDERRGAQVNEADTFRASYQSLDFLCKQHFGISYKKSFKLDKKNMASSDLGETLIYNAVDTKYTLRLWHTQRNILKRCNLLPAYRDAIPRQPTVALMQYLGVGVDQPEIESIQKELGVEIEAISEEIANLKVVKQYRIDHGLFNPMSHDDLVAVFKDYLHRDEIIVSPKKAFDFGVAAAAKKKAEHKPAKYSVDKHVLEKIPHPLARLVIELRNVAKLKSTYIDCFKQGEGKFIWPDGLIHTYFNTTFTETGRTSSDEPNIQNFPKRNDAWVRRIIVPPKSHVLLAFDYGQLEGCTAAMCSKDKVLVKAMWENYDIHTEWMERLVKRYPLWVGGAEAIADPAVARKYRNIAKNKLVFPAVFGASTDSIAGYLKVPEDVAEDIMADFWQIFTGLKSWQDRLMKQYYETGYVASPTGRWHRYPLRRNQVINFPVQGVAADIVCDSMNVLSELAVTTNEMHLHPILNIHDDLTFVVPDSKSIIDSTIDTISQVMLHPQYDFINVPLSVEVAKGHNWYEMKAIGKHWSNESNSNTVER